MSGVEMCMFWPNHYNKKGGEKEKGPLRVESTSGLH